MVVSLRIRMAHHVPRPGEVFVLVEDGAYPDTRDRIRVWENTPCFHFTQHLKRGNRTITLRKLNGDTFAPRDVVTSR